MQVRKLKLIDGGNGTAGTDDHVDGTAGTDAVVGSSRRGKAMKVAFCTQDLKRVDAHFGWARNIAIYDVDEAGYRLLEAVQFGGSMFEDGNEDKLAPKLEALQDCAIVYLNAIGASAAARIVARKIHPVKIADPEPITEILDRLIETLKGSPPPWLRKALGKTRETTFRYDDDEEEA